MKPRFSACVLVLMLLGLAGCQLAPTAPDAAPDLDLWQPDPVAEARYRELVAVAQRNPREVDYDELRALFPLTRWYQPYGGREQALVPRAYRALEAGRPGDALDLADRILDHNFVSLDAHYLAREACLAQGMEDEAAWHDYVLRQLFDSIRGSGDGTRPESAFRVISTTELHAFLALYNLEAEDQELVVEELGPFDRLRVRHRETGELFELYFDISAQWRRGFHGI